MALQLREVSLGLDRPEADLQAEVARKLNLSPENLVNLRIVRRSIDARKRPRVLLVYTVQFDFADEAGLLALHQANGKLEQVSKASRKQIVTLSSPPHVLVVGMGPSGLFAAWQLARHGVNVTLLEQGRPVEQRVRDVDRFWNSGEFDPVSNVQFGEGGAGTFSDGKLTTRLNHPDTSLILETLVGFGAPADILVDSKPHVGTDRLRAVLVRFRKALLTMGVDIRFESKLTGLQLSGTQIVGGLVNDQDELSCDALVLAPGHSARDTYAMLSATGVTLEAKPFAVGLRVDHPVELINRIQYGMNGHPRLSAADYRLAWNDKKTGRGVYSFCMCPGGEVVNATSEAGTVVVNGMSHFGRDTLRSNSALVVSVGPNDFGTHPLDGVDFQRQLEKKAFRMGGEGFHAPAQNLMTFLGRGHGPVGDPCRPGVREADLCSLFPAALLPSLRQGIVQFDRKMKGFVTREAVLVGVESRTSSPLRILRDKAGESLSHPGLFPTGEGAGYAGGIMSAALDGLRVAEEIITRAKVAQEDK